MAAVRFVLLAALVLTAFTSQYAVGQEISDRVVPGGIEVLGWDASSARIYYLTAVRPNRDRPDSAFYLRYYDLSDSTDGQPHTLRSAFPGEPDSAVELRRSATRLRRTLAPMPGIPSPPGATVQKTNPRGWDRGDYTLPIADYRVEYNGLTGVWTSYEACNAPMHLVVRRVHLAPNERDGVAILQSPGPPGCEFARVVLISRRSVPALQLEWSQEP